MDSKILLGKFCIVALIILLGCTKSEVGPSELTSLVKITQEAAGANCANGGFKIETGIDTNKNSVLDTDEIQSTAYICNGANGASGTTGTNGTDGLTSLIKVTAEAAGANCSAGGYRIDTGIDDNADGILETSEIDNTIYVCNGSSGNLVSGNSAFPFGVGFKALLTGTAQDGTTFSDSINFKYPSFNQQYDYFGSYDNMANAYLYLYLYRYPFTYGSGSSSINYLGLDLTISNFGTTIQSASSDGASMEIQLPIGDKLLSLNPYSQTSAIPVTYPIDPSNSTYPFAFQQQQLWNLNVISGLSYNGGNSYSSIFNLISLSNNSVNSTLSNIGLNATNLEIKFLTTTGDSVYYQLPLSNGASGSFVKIVSAQGVTSTSSATYGNIHLVNNFTDDAVWSYYNSNGFKFYDSNNNDLSKTITVPADVANISNFNYNTTNGLLTFDYQINWGVLSNGTHNPLTLTGNFSGYVYVQED